MNHWIKQNRIKSLQVYLFGYLDNGEEFIVASRPFQQGKILWDLHYPSTVLIGGTYIESPKYGEIWRQKFPSPVAVNTTDTFTIDYSAIQILFR